MSLTPKPLLVTAAVIYDGRELLIAQRRFADRIEPGKWEFPGGKVEFGETPEACLAREIREELNLEIEVGKLIGVSSHVYHDPIKPLHVVLLCYRCQIKTAKSELRHLAVQDSRWILSIDFSRYDFAAADIPLLQEVLRIEANLKIS
jgi:8-oxo-dGTP diphosphatase